MSTTIQDAAERRFDHALTGLTSGKLSIAFTGEGDEKGSYSWSVTHEDAGSRDVTFYPAQTAWHCTCDDFASYGERIGHCQHTITVWLGNQLQDDAQANGVRVGELLDGDPDLAESMKMHFIEATLEARGDDSDQPDASGDTGHAKHEDANAGTRADANTDAAPDTPPSNGSTSANGHGPTAPAPDGDAPPAAPTGTNGTAAATVAPPPVQQPSPNGDGADAAPDTDGDGAPDDDTVVVFDSPRFTDEIIQALKAPFDPKFVGWKAQATFRRNGKRPTRQNPADRALVVAYVDARAVMNRLDKVVGPDNWTDDYRTVDVVETDNGLEYSVECSLTVFGVTKRDVGIGDDLKAAYSDALKRAAVKFYVARYLYYLPKQYVDFDGQKNRLDETPQLPRWAIPSQQQAA